MKKNSLILILLLCIYTACKQNKKTEVSNQEENLIVKKLETYTNPILKGFYPDPSICRVNSNYYLINSTFAYFPGIPIFHSTDLVNWKQIGHVLDRPEQLDLDGMEVSRGIFAPTIRYHEGTFYVICTVVDGKGNFIVTATNPSGPWSNPTWIPEMGGIDPSIFFDDDGKVYLVHNEVAPDDKELYPGHRTIRMFEFDLNTLKVVGKSQILINGGTDINKKPIWIEGPHLLKKNDYYYLIAAEGGTSIDHSEVVFRSKSIEGPYESYKKNPILTQRHLNKGREDAITNTGHADIIETPQGEWWGVFLGCRPYKNNYFNTGRETFMAPVIWKDGWPTFNLDGDLVKHKYPLPKGSKPNSQNFKYSGNFQFKEEFDKEILGYHWTFLRTVKEPWYSLSKNKGSITLKTRPESCSSTVNPSFIAHRQQHINSSVSTKLSFTTTTPNEKAGLIAFQNEKHFYYLCKSIEKEKPVIQLYQSVDDGMKLITSKIISSGSAIRLKIKSDNNAYQFLYATDHNDWQLIKDKMDSKFLSTEIAGGFVGSMYAMYTTSLGKKSTNTAVFDWFEYIGDDQVYR